MKRLRLIAGRCRVTRVALVALGWLGYAVGAQACGLGHSMPVIMAPPAFFGTPIARPVVSQVTLPANAAQPQDPFHAQGPCQGPQCDGRPAPTDMPITSPTDQSRERWDAAWPTDDATAGPLTTFLSRQDSARPELVRGAIFHPPRFGA